MVWKKMFVLQLLFVLFSITNADVPINQTCEWSGCSDDHACFKTVIESSPAFYNGSECSSPAPFGYTAACDNNSTCSSCSDNVQNGDETGIDCGGTTCDACGDAAIQGCTDNYAGNFDVTATDDDGSCMYTCAHENFQCDITSNRADFDSAVYSTHTAETCCTPDACNVPNGSNSTCSDCIGVPNGDAIFDDCGVCQGDNSTCEIIEDSSYSSDESSDSCNGKCGGQSAPESCYCDDICKENDDCCDDVDYFCPTDCLGTFFGTAIVDHCGVCDGLNTTLDLCGICNGANACVTHCDGHWESCNQYNCEQIYNITTYNNALGDACMYQHGDVRECENPVCIAVEPKNLSYLLGPIALFAVFKFFNP